jgi:hypothetical protein
LQPASTSSDGNDSNDGSAEVDSTAAAGGAMKKGWMAPKTEKCTVCDQTVYIVERLEADGLVYHKVGLERFPPVHLGAPVSVPFFRTLRFPADRPCLPSSPPDVLQMQVVQKDA